jgi:hypothetical protein
MPRSAKAGRKYDAPIGRQSAAIEPGCDILACYGWKRERRNRIVGHGKCGDPGLREELDSATESYAISAAYVTLANLLTNRR